MDYIIPWDRHAGPYNVAIVTVFLRQRDDSRATDETTEEDEEEEEWLTVHNLCCVSIAEEPDRAARDDRHIDHKHAIGGYFQGWWNQVFVFRNLNGAIVARKPRRFADTDAPCICCTVIGITREFTVLSWENVRKQ